MFKQLKYLNPTIYLAALMTISAVLCFFCIHEGHVWGDDFALYIAQSKAILDGTTADLYQKNVYLTDNSEILEGGPIGPYLYPIGFPLLLSDVYWLKGMDLMSMKIFCTLFFILSLPLIYNLFSTRFLNKKYSLLLTAYVGLNFAIIVFTDNILSDFPFFFFMFLSLYLIEKNRLNIGYQLLLSAAIIMSYLIRDIGLVLMPVLIVQLYFKAQEIEENTFNYFKKNSLFIVPIALFCVFFLLKSVFLKADNTNLFTALSAANFKTILSNAGYYVYVLGELFNANSNYILRSIILFLLGLFFLNGIYKSEKRDRHFILLIVLTMGLYIVFPGRQGLRYLFAIVPFIFYFSIKGILDMPFSFFKQFNNAILIGLVIYIGGNSVYNSIKFKEIKTDEITTPEAVDLYKWLEINTLPSDIIAFKKPRLLRLMTGRNGFSNSDDTKVLQSTANYLIEYDKPMRINSAFKSIYQNKFFIVYSINH